MKKTISLILVIALSAFVLAACGGSKDVTLTILDTEYAVEDYAICVAKENTELLEKINKALEELKKEGKIEEIVGKYIKD